MSKNEKKHQVFVSSTFQDLQEERKEVIHALLELDCIPSGMELFPAANEDQWSLIKRVIDDCDYYIVILGGRYGSLGPDGVGFTEMEYRYAIESGKPVIGFVHKDPGSIPANKTESTDEGKKKLIEFRDLVQKKMCKFWTDAKDLGSVVSRSLISLRRQHPGVGWVRADGLASEEAMAEILALRKTIEGLEAQLRKSRTEAPEGAEELAQGEQLYYFEVEFNTSKVEDEKLAAYRWNQVVSVTWNDMFSWVCPSLLQESSSSNIKSRIKGEVRGIVRSWFTDADEDDPDDAEFIGHDAPTDYAIAVSETDLETVLVQFLALGYIAKSEKPRSVKDPGEFWTLTPYGTKIMYQLRAIPADRGESD